MKPETKWWLFWGGISGCLAVLMVIVTLLPHRRPGIVPEDAVKVASAEHPGLKALLAQGCEGCHSIGGRGGRLGPKLDHVGSRRGRDWLTAFVRDPKAYDSRTVMPSYAHLAPDKFQHLIDYLSQLK